MSVVLPSVIEVPAPDPVPAGAGPLPEPLSVIRQMLAVATDGLQVCQGEGFYYFLKPGQLLTHKCGARLPTSLTHLKVDAFRQHWQAEMASCEAGTFVLDLPLEATFWHRCLGRRPALRVRVSQVAPRTKSELLTGVHVDIWPLDCRPEQAVTALARLGPEVLQSLRTFLHAEPERHAQERVPFEHALGVFPVLDETTFGEAMVCRGKDLSLGGISFFAPQEPPTDRLYVQAQLSPELSAVGLLGQVVRVQGRDELYEVGHRFEQGSEALVSLLGGSRLVC